jgi:hypothetical protein
MAGNPAKFWSQSLLVDAGCEPNALDPSGLWPSAPADGTVRAFFHETVHFWQALSQSFLVRLADEEWQRLRAWERTGTVPAPGDVRRVFERCDSEVGWSARDLHECLARFWDVIAAGPTRVLQEEWDAGRADALPDVREVLRRRRAEAGLPKGAWGKADLIATLIMAAGHYASPFLTIAGEELEYAEFTFPWLAHFALQTRAPAETFDRFVREVGPELALQVNELLETPGIPPSELFEFTMTHLFISASMLCVVNAEHAKDPVGLSDVVFRESSLITHPLYSWIFRGPVLRTAAALGKTQLARQLRRSWDYPRNMEGFVGVQLLHRALATPALPESRTLLLAAGIVPPCVRYSDGTVQPLGRVFRDDVASWTDDWQKNEILWKATSPARQLDLASEEQRVTNQCAAMQRRWEAFAKASQGGVRTQPSFQQAPNRTQPESQSRAARKRHRLQRGGRRPERS